MKNHVVVTPVRNESDFLPETIDSMVKQTIIPSQWIVVDDSSTDGTRGMLEEAEKEFKWIKLVRVGKESNRERGRKIARLVNSGIANIDTEWTYLSKIDADIILPENYFEMIIEELENDEELGIASGNCFLRNGEGRKIEKVEFDHTRGALKTYRKECFAKIGGIREVDGWDGLDNHIAQFHGWKTKNFPGILAEHRRATGSRDGVMSNFIWAGQKSHFLSYSWPYLIAKVLANMFRRPLIIGGVLILIGFIQAKILRKEKVEDRELADFIRKTQMRKLLRRIRMRGP